MKLEKRKFRTNTYEEVRAGEGLDLIEIMHRFNNEISVMNYEDLEYITEEMNDCYDTDYTLVEYYNDYLYTNREIDKNDIKELKSGKAIIIYGLSSSGEGALAFIDNKDDEEEIVKGLNDIFENIYDGEYRVELDEEEI